MSLKEDIIPYPKKSIILFYKGQIHLISTELVSTDQIAQL